MRILSEQQKCQGLEMASNSLTHQERGRPALVDEVIGAAPFMEVRQDKDGAGIPEDRDVGEAINAEIIARALNRLNKLATFNLHSHEAAEYFKAEGIDLLNLTVAPLFANHIKENLFTQVGVVNENEDTLIDPANTRIVALDKGSLQQCIYLSTLLGMDPADHIVAFDKKRKGHNMVADAAMIYGNSHDLIGKDIIIYDDIIDTFGSMEKTCKSLKDIYHCRSITVMATHGVLSYPGRQNIINALQPNGGGDRVVNRIIMTDTLPDARYAMEDIPDVTIMNVGELFGKFVHAYGARSKDELSNDVEFRPYIFDIKDKEEVWNDFVKQYAKEEKLDQTPMDDFSI